MIWSQRYKCFGSKYIIIKHNTAIITGLNTYNAMHVVVNYITISAATNVSALAIATACFFPSSSIWPWKIIVVIRRIDLI